MPLACPACGTINPDGGRFCGNCAAPLQPVEPGRGRPIGAVPPPVAPAAAPPPAWHRRPLWHRLRRLCAAARHAQVAVPAPVPPAAATPAVAPPPVAPPVAPPAAAVAPPVATPPVAPPPTQPWVAPAGPPPPGWGQPSAGPQTGAPPTGYPAYQPTAAPAERLPVALIAGGVALLLVILVRGGVVASSILAKPAPIPGNPARADACAQRGRRQPSVSPVASAGPGRHRRRRSSPHRRSPARRRSRHHAAVSSRRLRSLHGSAPACRRRGRVGREPLGHGQRAMDRRRTSRTTRSTS